MLLLCSKVFDPETASFTSEKTVVVDETSGLIAEVRNTKEEDLQAKDVIDLRGLTVLPGFTDAHVHLFLYPYAITSWMDQVTKQTIVERTVRAVNHAKDTLLAGFTAVRDLGTEGALDADVALRKCISTPTSITPGPRYFCVTKAIVSTGSYGPKGELNPSSEGVDGAIGAEAADGPDECRRVVRRQIGAGADWIKIYADYRFRSRLASISKASAANLPLFDEDELKAMIDTAHSLGVKVAAHASMAESIKVCSRLGVDSIEHGYEADQEALDAMAKYGVTFVPTLGAYYSMRGGSRGAFTVPGSTWEKAQKVFKAALKTKGLKLAVGGDTGVFRHGDNALEMRLMYELGMPWKDVLLAATRTGWELLRGVDWEEDAQEKIKGLAKIAASEEKPDLGDNDLPFGDVKPGFAADIIATSGDLEKDFVDAIDASQISFVMKAGQVYKRGGKGV